MKISEGISILRAEKEFERTLNGRPISKYALDVVKSVINDTKNYDNQLIQCLGCGFVSSVLITSEGCPNCGVLDLTLNINTGNPK
jgi:rubrerythrin